MKDQMERRAETLEIIEIDLSSVKISSDEIRRKQKTSFGQSIFDIMQFNLIAHVDMFGRGRINKHG